VHQNVNDRNCPEKHADDSLTVKNASPALERSLGFTMLCSMINNKTAMENSELRTPSS
jgi:hypothetical protein